MEKLIISGGRRLSGSVSIPAAKNSLLPLLAACVLTEGTTRFFNCPNLSDIANACSILRELGIETSFSNGVIIVKGGKPSGHEIDKASMGLMRGSLMFLGPILASRGRASAYMPGGCRIGKRPIDIHFDVFRALGAEVLLHGEKIELFAPNGLKGADIHLRFCSVGATENAILASVTAHGNTRISGAAREPEIGDLIDYLNGCGARIKGKNTDLIEVEGVDGLSGRDFCPVPDRIVASTMIAAVAIAGGWVEMRGIEGGHLKSFVNISRDMGISISQMGDRIVVNRGAGDRLGFPDYGVVATPYPGFSTDCTPLITAMMCVADGYGSVTDSIFEDRFGCCKAFRKLGANVVVCGRTAAICGTDRIVGGEVLAEDLRGGAALACLALCACGEVVIDGLGLIDRGYFRIEEMLSALGADIKRVDV